MNELVKQLLRGKIVPAVLSIVLGIALILAQRSAFDVLVKITGVLTVIGGVGFVCLYFFGPVTRDKSALVLGCIAVVLGVVMFIYANVLDEIFISLMGVVLILNGLSNVTEARLDTENRLLSAVFGVAVIILGILIILHPGSMMNGVTIYLGIFFVVNGLADLFLLHRMKDILMDRDKDKNE